MAETCARRVTRLRVRPDGDLTDRETFGPSDHGAFIDGIAFDSHGNLWGTHVMTDRIFAITPEGDLRIRLNDDRDSAAGPTLMAAFARDEATLDLMLACGGTIAPWFASITFGGPDLRTVHIGSLRGTRISRASAHRSPACRCRTGDRRRTTSKREERDLKHHLTGAIAGSLLAASILAGPANAEISDGVVKIGVLTDMSGVYSDITGKGSVLAARMAADDCLKAECAGLKIEILSADNQNKADVASTIAREWIDRQGVDACATTIVVSGWRQLRWPASFRFWLLEAAAHVWFEGGFDVLVGDGDVEPFRIEVASAPAFGVGVLRMGAIRHDGEEVVVAAGSADVLGRPCPSTVRAGG